LVLAKFSRAPRHRASARNQPPTPPDTLDPVQLTGADGLTHRLWVATELGCHLRWRQELIARRRRLDHAGDLPANVSGMMRAMPKRFLTLKNVAEELLVEERTVRRLISTGDLPAIQVGGRGVWRIEASKLEEYIQTQYEATRRRIADGTAQPEHEGDEDQA
jgi:excisionase family DNA binding protein